MASISFIILILNVIDEKKMANKETELLIEAIINNNINEVSLLLKKNINPNHSLDSANVTPLHFAAQSNHTHIAEKLIKHGADPLAQTQPDGETPLDIAKLHQHTAMINLLSK